MILRQTTQALSPQCSHDENFAFLNQKDTGDSAIVLENPKTSEFQVVRTSLLPGVFKTIRENRKHSLPLRVFEVSDVAFKDDKTERERMARNERHAVAVYCNKAANFEIIHGLLDRLMKALGVPRITRDDVKSQKGFYLEEAEGELLSAGDNTLLHSLTCLLQIPHSSLAEEHRSSTDRRHLPIPAPRRQLAAWRRKRLLRWTL